MINLKLNNPLLISKSNLVVWCTCLCLCVAWVTKVIFIILIPLLLNFRYLFSNINYLSYFLFSSLFILFLDFNKFIVYTTMWMSILIYSNKFYDNINNVLLIFSKSLFLMLLMVICLFEPLKGSWSDIFQFNQRLWLVSPSGMEVNPNPLGVICAICAFGFFINKKYILMVFPLIILLLTQSRASMVFFLILYFMHTGITLRKFFLSVLLSIPFIYVALTSNISNRFSEAGENGRLERMSIYLGYIKNNYLVGMSSYLYDDLVALYGSLDNMYLLSVARYGLFGIIFLLYLILVFLKNFSFDISSKTRFAIFLSVFILGVAESGLIANNYLLWLFFALSIKFSNVKKGY